MTWTAFVAGIAASLAANVAHAQPTIGARFVAGWAPLALLLTIEVMMRVPAPRSSVLNVARFAGTTVVAGVAAVASFRHMKGLALQYGEDALTATTLPLSVDGLVVVASIALLTLADRRRTTTAAGQPVPPTPPTPSADRPSAATRPEPAAPRHLVGVAATPPPTRTQPSPPTPTPAEASPLTAATAAWPDAPLVAETDTLPAAPAPRNGAHVPTPRTATDRPAAAAPEDISAPSRVGVRGLPLALPLPLPLPDLDPDSQPSPSTSPIRGDTTASPR